MYKDAGENVTLPAWIIPTTFILIIVIVGMFVDYNYVVSVAILIIVRVVLIIQYEKIIMMNNYDE